MSSAGPSRGVRATEGGAQSVTSPKILVVDDIQDNLDLVVKLFEGERWNTRSADNSKDAWALIKRGHPDLVHLDIQMPDYNGYHWSTAIRMNPGMDDNRMSFLTAERTREDEMERGMKMGAAVYVCNPIDGATLRERVRAVVERCPNGSAAARERSGTSHGQGPPPRRREGDWEMSQ